MRSGPWAQTTVDHLLRKAVPGPYHAVKDWDGELYISGAPDRVVCNAETIELAVLGLERFRADAELDQTPEDELEDLKANFDELEGENRELEKSRQELKDEIDSLNQSLNAARDRILSLEKKLGAEDDSPHHT